MCNIYVYTYGIYIRYIHTYIHTYIYIHMYICIHTQHLYYTQTAGMHINSWTGVPWPKTPKTNLNKSRNWTQCTPSRERTENEWSQKEMEA